MAKKTSPRPLQHHRESALTLSEGWATAWLRRAARAGAGLPVVLGLLQGLPAWAQSPACEAWTPAQVADTRVDITGGVLKAYACRDPDGQHLFLASGIPQLKSVPDAGSTEVHFYKFTRSGDRWAKKWEARDFLVGTGSGIDVATFEIQPADGGATSVAYMSYRLRSAGVPTEEGKLLVFYKDRKFAVRGAIARGTEDFASRSIDPGFSALPTPVQAHALGLWDTLTLPSTRVR